MPGLGTPTARTRAQQLRRQMTKPERLLWSCLRDHRTGLHFRRQHAVGPYVMDFYSAAARLCVEVDGASHEMTSQHDGQRDAVLLREFGIVTLRVAASNVLKNLDGVVAYVAEPARQQSAPSLAGASCSP